MVENKDKPMAKMTPMNRHIARQMIYSAEIECDLP